MTTYREQPIPAEDLELIQTQGVPLEPSPLYVEFLEHGAITLSPRGVKLYRLACLLHGLSPRHAESITSVEQLLDLSLKIKRVRMILTQEIDTVRGGGGVPLRSRGLVQAVMFGTTEELHRAMELRLLCEEAGENVIPASFGRTPYLGRNRHE